MTTHTTVSRRSSAMHMSLVIAVALGVPVAFWSSPGFTGTLQDVEKQGEKAAKDTEKAAGKALHDAQQSGGKAAHDTEKAAGKALQDTQKIFKGGHGGKSHQAPATPDSPVPTSDGGSPSAPAPPPAGAFQPSDTTGAYTGSGFSSNPGSFSTYSESAAPSAPPAEPPKPPDFSLGSNEGGMQGGASWYDKLGSGTAMPPAAPGQGFGMAPAPSAPSSAPAPFSQDTTR